MSDFLEQLRNHDSGQYESPAHAVAALEGLLQEAADEIERVSGDLTTAYLTGYHKRDDEVAALKDAVLIARTTEANLHVEIDRLRGLLRETEPILEIGDDDCDACVEMGNLLKRVREALGDD